MRKARKTLEYLAAGLLGFATIAHGCAAVPNQYHAQSQIKKQVSHKLEDLCDTETETIKKLNLHVYIEPSKNIWDYHEYKDEIFGYVKDFFAKYNVDCNVTFHPMPLKKPYLECNEKGIEIFASSGTFRDRFAQLKKWETKKEKKWAEENTRQRVGIAVTEKGIALLNGAWEYWRGEMSEQEVKEQFPESKYGINKKEYIIRQQAGNIAHEILHCLGLFHTRTFEPDIVPEDRNLLPNVMGYEAPMFTGKHHPIGKILIPVQRKLLHSHLTGNGAYKAFQDNNHNLTRYLEKIAHSNKIKPVYKKPTCTDGTIIYKR